MCELFGKADLLSDHFDSKQSRESVNLLLTCHPSPSLITFALRSSEIRHLLLDLDLYGGTDPLGTFHIFLKRTADVMASCLSVVSQTLVCMGSFPACWRQACHLNSERSTILLCCALLTYFHNISII